jgi:hypothetical protein
MLLGASIRNFNSGDLDGVVEKHTEEICSLFETQSKTDDLVKVTLVPVEVFGTDGYGLSDAVGAQSDCNRARGHIYRRDDTYSIPHRNPEDVITIYVPREELSKFDKDFSA